MADQSILPTESAWFTSQKRRIDRAYDLGTQQNNYEKALAEKQYGWDRGDLLKRLADQRNQIPGMYQKRGLAQSGLQQRGLLDFAADRTRSLGRLGEANDLKMFGHAMTANQLRRVQSESLTDLTRQQDALRELRAQTLRGM